VGQDSARRDAAHTGIRHPAEVGWDESLYDDAGQHDAARVPGQGTRSPEAGAGGPVPGGPGAGGLGNGQGGGDGSKRRRKRPGRWRALRWTAGVLSLLVLGTAGAGYLYYQHLNSNLRSDSRAGGASGVAKPKANAAGQTPLNILLIGSDSRASAANVKLGGGKDLRDDPPLADVQMLLHVSADRKNASLVSIPRDTRVDIPQCTDARTGTTYPATNAIINTTLARGGPGCTLSTWEKMTGVYIDHWITVDFAGVVQMADAVGGVPVCVKENIWDRSTPDAPGGSGLKLTAGTHDVRGAQALQWLRTRHAFGSDPNRIEAQHMYLDSMFRVLKAQDYFTNPAKLNGLAEAATKALEVSSEIGSVKKLFDLAEQLKGVPIDRITSVTMPTLPDPENPNNHLVVNKPDADQLWTLLRDDIPLDKNGNSSEGAKQVSSPSPTVPPGSTPGETAVSVRNATGSSTLAAVVGRAGDISSALAAKGYTRTATDPGATSQDSSAVLYASSDQQGDAQAVAKALGMPLSSVTQSSEVTDVTVVVGADWRSGDTFPAPQRPKAGAVPTTANALNGADTGCMDVYAPYRW
jgi:LCP family protein required for cell wall assembly